MVYNVGDTVRMTTLTWGEAITKNGKVLPQHPCKDTYTGVVTYAGPELANAPSKIVVRCSGGNDTLKTKLGFQFYPDDNGEEQIVTVLRRAPVVVSKVEEAINAFEFVLNSLERGMPKSIQRLVARENREYIAILRSKL